MMSELSACNAVVFLGRCAVSKVRRNAESQMKLATVRSLQLKATTGGSQNHNERERETSCLFLYFKCTGEEH
jgi:uncharacterized cysteine cluster protein YcgN (CxxCxxCC family)